jgi:hypothetical protein
MRAMLDLICLAVIVVCFAVGAVFTRGCEKLEKEEE